jgi:transcription-repair coupling factor (superfamily II helicase)
MILTRELYAAAIDRYHAAEKARLLSRYDLGAKEHGDLELLGTRDWEEERRQELDDARAYEIFAIEARKEKAHARCGCRRSR